MPAEIIRTESLRCIGVSKKREFPLKKRVSVDVTIGKNGKREVTCPLREGTICTAAELKNRTQCIQLAPSLTTQEDLPPLTQPEKRVLIRAARGFANKQIGTSLFLSEETVRTRVKRILDKYNVHDRTKASVKGIKTQDVQPDMLAAGFSFSVIRYLSPEQIDLMRELADPEQPTTNQAISERLHCAPDTTKGKLSALFKFMGLRNRTHAAVFYTLADMQGLIPQTDDSEESRK
jgi:DNA-binding NarL/FixJ family response regulator